MSHNRIEGTIEQYFSLQGHLLSTVSADAHKANDKSRNESITLWLHRQGLAPESALAESFLGRLEALHDIKPSVSAIKSFGLDANGLGFAILPNLDGHAITSGNLEASEAERRFISCLRIVDRVHRAGLVCGDISGGSFWVDRAGDVSFIGVMGLFTEQGVTDGPRETLPFVAPEVALGSAASKQSDVFSLGVLGYRLLTGTFPYHEGEITNAETIQQAQVRPLRGFIDIPPVWAEEVINLCLQADPALRFSDTTEILSKISEMREQSYNNANALKPVNAAPAKPKVTSQQTSGLTTVPVVRQQTADLPAEVPTGSVMASKIVLGALGVVLTVLVLVVLLNVFGKESQPLGADPSGISLAGGNSEINEALSESPVSGALMQKVETLRDSDDPVAHQALVEIALGDDKGARNIAEKAIVARARRKGLLLSGEQVKQWLRTVSNIKASPEYAAVLKSLDASLPQTERDGLLREAYRSNPVLVMRLAIALAFDLDALQDFQPIVSQLIGDALELDAASEYSTLALVMAHKDLALIFEDKIVQNRNSLSDKDIRWILDILAKRDDVNTRSIANLALERKLLNPMHEDLLKIIRDRSDVPPEVVSAIVHVSSGATSIADIQVFGRWYDREVEPILLSILASNNDVTILQEAFDTLAGKSPTVEPSATLIEWVRSKYWDNRVDFAPLIGVLGIADSASSELKKEALQSLDAYVDNTKTIHTLLNTESPIIIKYLLENHDARVDIGSKLNLLRHSDKDVRLTVIDSIKTNDVAALKMILQAYEVEKDPEVREKFKKFWVVQVKEREG